MYRPSCKHARRRTVGPPSHAAETCTTYSPLTSRWQTSPSGGPVVFVGRPATLFAGVPQTMSDRDIAEPCGWRTVAMVQRYLGRDPKGVAARLRVWFAESGGRSRTRPAHGELEVSEARAAICA